MRFHYKGKKLFGLVLTCLGVGILLVLILPYWGWLALGGAALICFGWYCFRH